MSGKPVIGINTEFRPTRKDAVALSWLNTGYYDSVAAAGGLPVLIPPYAEDDELKQALEMLDGLVLCGCNLDLDPVRLGFERHPATRPMPVRREDFDRRLCKLAVEMKIPTLAIGQGMQILNVVCGGTLYQHIPEDFTKPLHHRDSVETNLRHIIDIVPGTRMDHIYGPGEIRINSQHHMAVDQVADLFQVSATAPDGVVEAYESISEDWFCLGVQWHPENETASALDMQVFQAFLAACDDSEQMILTMPKSRTKSKAKHAA
ncbi:MAG: gamma-glutamyl-gamma-aminobutyrate hydrolase family protein [Planctomycetaceae bacterium]